MAEAHDQEKALLQDGPLPLINAMGASAAASHPIINAAVRAQLEVVLNEATHYLEDPKQMPHQWGSMDTYDDMRNSVRAVSMLLECLLDGPVDGEGSEAERKLLREAARESGLCAISERLLLLAYPGTANRERIDAAHYQFDNEQSQRESDEYTAKMGTVERAAYLKKWVTQSEGYAYEEEARRNARKGR